MKKWICKLRAHVNLRLLVVDIILLIMIIFVMLPGILDIFALTHIGYNKEIISKGDFTPFYQEIYSLKMNNTSDDFVLKIKSNSNKPEFWFCIKNKDGDYVPTPILGDCSVRKTNQESPKVIREFDSVKYTPCSIMKFFGYWPKTVKDYNDNMIIIVPENAKIEVD